ncbi:galactonate dehydratase, partial [Archaeoglobales archaeon]
IGLGCEQFDAHKLADEIKRKGRECDSLLIQEHGEAKVVDKGVEIIKKVKKSLVQRKEKFSIDELVIGVKCGASDYSSALISNPAVGKAVDFLIESGGTVIFGERLEVVGAEHIIARRTKNKAVREDFLRRIKRAIEEASKAGVDWVGSQPSLGNIEGGITTIEEKSLGAIKKAGSFGLSGCLDYGEKPKGKGLFFMDTPGYDVQCVSGLVAGGCHEILFTTGRGTYLGSPVSPVIKICGNPLTCNKLRDAIDVDLSFILESGNLEEGGKKIIEKIISVANGELTRAEKTKHYEFSIERIGITA